MIIKASDLVVAMTTTNPRFVTSVGVFPDVGLCVGAQAWLANKRGLLNDNGSFVSYPRGMDYVIGALLREIWPNNNKKWAHIYQLKFADNKFVKPAEWIHEENKRARREVVLFLERRIKLSGDYFINVPEC